MRFPKTLTYCCLLAVGTATLAFSQDSSDAQQKALDALRQYTAEKEGKTSKPLTTKPVKKASDDAAAKELEQKAREAAKQQTPPAAAKPAPVAATPAPAVAATTSAATPAGETENERKAREALDALRRGDASSQPQSLSAKTTPAQPGNQEDAIRAALDAQYSTGPTGAAAQPVMEVDARETIKVMNDGTVVETTEVVVVSEPKPKTRKEKLNDLLELYRDNAITPRQYHDKRAMIIAGN